MKNRNLKKVIIYTDGACSGNPGPGGWAAVLRYNGHRKVLTGAEVCTTNNRMELRAALEALKALKEPCEVELYTDSAYLARAFQEGWLWNWARRGWRKANGKPVENQDLWKELYELARKHRIRVIKVRGHAGIPENEEVDRLAVAAMKALQSSTSTTSPRPPRASVKAETKSST